jgi:hypothetical protein
MPPMKRGAIAAAALVWALQPAPAYAHAQDTLEIRFIAYTTGYGYHDNTPAGDRISHATVHATAGGTGTHDDPITLAVGHSVLSGGRDALDYAPGTRFYIPSLRKYFVVEDTCGDGDSPQDGPCHSGYEGHVWLDLWVGGKNSASATMQACENAVTGKRLVIQNPTPHYLVSAGPIVSAGCAPLYEEEVAARTAQGMNRGSTTVEAPARLWQAAWVRATPVAVSTQSKWRQAADVADGRMRPWPVSMLRVRGGRLASMTLRDAPRQRGT